MRLLSPLGILPILIVVGGSPAVAIADDRLAVPGADEQANATTLVRDLFKTEYADPRPSAKAALAVKLLRQAAETKDDPAVRYVLLREGRDIAAKAGDAVTAMKAAEDMAATFQVSVGEAFIAVAEQLATAATSPTTARSATESLLAAAGERPQRRRVANCN